MSKKDNTVLAILAISFIIMIFLLAYFIVYMRCHQIANKLNYSCEYGFFTGCILENKNGDKFLLEQLREMK